MTLLAFYLENPKQTALLDINVDRIIKSCDIDYCRENKLAASLNELTNYMVTDIPKRTLPYDNRYALLNISAIPGIRGFLPRCRPGEEFFNNRREHIMAVLTEFFVGSRL